MVCIRKTVTLSPSSAFVLLSLWRAFPLPLPTRQIRLHRTAAPSLAGTLSAATAGTLLPLRIAGTSTAEWLSSLGDSPRPSASPAVYSTIATPRACYRVSWYSTTSLARPKVQKGRRQLGTVRPRPARPCSPYGFGVQYVFPLGQLAIVVYPLRSVGPGP